MDAIPIVLFGTKFWKKIVNFDALLEEVSFKLNEISFVNEFLFFVFVLEWHFLCIVNFVFRNVQTEGNQRIGSLVVSIRRHADGR